jgi:hypothetical protein
MVISNEQNIIRELGDGLILRRSTPADAEKLGAFNAMIHSDDGPDNPDDRLAAWTRDLLERPHPTFGSGDFTIVEEQATGRVISSLNLIPQTWEYEGIPFKVGRPELVGTLPEFRHHGLVRIQFEEVHKWSAARGELVQAITGIPYYYRLFGYEMGLELGGGRMGFEPNLPRLREGVVDPYRVRVAVESDIPFLMETYALNQKRSLISAVWDEAMWRYAIDGRSERNINRDQVRIIEDSQSSGPVGYLVHPWFLWGEMMPVYTYALKVGISWLAVTPSVVRYLWQTGEEYAQRDERKMMAFAFWHGTQHPVYEVFRDRLPNVREPYSWYIRVPDLPAFLRQITPALEKRIAESHIPGYSGDVRAGFYREGIRIVLEKGRIAGFEMYKPASQRESHATFPNLTFLQLVFGYRTMDELHTAYADCGWDGDETRVLLSTLFPKKSSSFIGIV